MGQILETKSIVDKIRKRLFRQRKRMGRLSLASLTVAGDCATTVYAAAQRKWALSLDVDYRNINIPSGSSVENAIDIINKLNKSRDIKGIIIHKPLPGHWDEMSLFVSIDINKDVEGLNPYNLGRVFFNKPALLPPVVLSTMELLKTVDIGLRGKNVVIVGFSSILGKPLSIILADRLATVSITHIGTFQAGILADYVRRADILITAVGKPNLIKGSWIKKGAVVIDVGVGELNNALVGDVEFAVAARRASFITPVYGGVGALTTAFLFSNFFAAAGRAEEAHSS